MSDARAETRVVHAAGAQQFRVGEGEDAAVLQYRLTPGRITFLHTRVPEALRGQGVAQELAHAGLEHAKAMTLRVVPICPFVQSYLEKHPEYQTMVED
jgi:predicted GNAT family acetyltransferase